jgi:membrane fusion protein (multidrug efflux system)
MLDNPPRSRFARLSEGRGRFILPVALVVLVAIGVLFYYYAGRESTDDAQLDGHVTQMSAKVGGAIIKVNVRDNQRVEAGTVLVEIDPRDYQVAVDRAEAELAGAQATSEAARVGVPIATTQSSSGVTTAQGGLQQADAGVEAAQRGVESARARLQSAQATERQREAEATRSAKDSERLEGLVKKDEVSKQQYDTAVAAAAVAKAAVEAAKASVLEAQTAIGIAENRVHEAQANQLQARAGVRVAQTAPQQVQVTKAQAGAAEARVQQLKAALAQARLNLEYTVVKAPSTGIVSRKTIEVGQVIAAGQPLLALVDTDRLWVTANFKETQLADIRVGQNVDVTVDAMGGQTYTGKVESIAAATGARFSLLPPENATGNFVKVVQRVPVKIVLDQGQDPEHRLRPGLSVVPVVHVR